VARADTAGVIAKFYGDLRELIDKSGHDQAYIARRLHMGKSTLSEILNGRRARPPHLDNVILPIVAICTGNDEQRALAWKRRHDVLSGIYQQTGDLRLRPPQTPARPGPAPGAVRPVRMLRADTATFTGRTEQIDEIGRLPRVSPPS